MVNVTYLQLVNRKTAYLIRKVQKPNADRNKSYAYNEESR